MAFVHQVRTLSRNTKGVTAMRLKEEDKMASMDIIPASLRKNMEEKSEDTSSTVYVFLKLYLLIFGLKTLLIKLINVLLSSLLC